MTCEICLCGRSVVKNGPEMVRSSLLPFFNNAADDLTQVCSQGYLLFCNFRAHMQLKKQL